MTRPVSRDYPRAKRPSVKRLSQLPPPLEEDEQRALIAWAALHETRYPELALLYHVPNAGDRHIAYAAKLKALGLKAGVPDLVLPVPRGGFHGLYIELKRRGGGTVSPHQRRWQVALSAQGYFSCIRAGWEAARDTLLDYLNLKD